MDSALTVQNQAAKVAYGRQTDTRAVRTKTTGCRCVVPLFPVIFKFSRENQNEQGSRFATGGAR
jgi:hypothetical protein